MNVVFHIFVSFIVLAQKADKNGGGNAFIFVFCFFPKIFCLLEFFCFVCLFVLCVWVP